MRFHIYLQTKKRYYGLLAYIYMSGDYAAWDELSPGIKLSMYYQGYLQIKCYNTDKYYVMMRRDGGLIIITILGGTDLNGDVDSDFMAVELHPVNI